MNPFVARLPLLPLVSLLAVPALAVLAVPPAAGAAPATCLGRPATIEAGNRDVVRGTDGDDVIVAHDVDRVLAFAGDDVVCATVRRGETLRIVAGDGDDRVDTRAETGDGDSQVEAELGAGDDTYLGGPAPDDVAAGDGQAPGRDTIVTGGGTDRVSSGVHGLANPDVVRLGAGAADDLHLHGRPTGELTDSGRSGTIFADDSGRLPWSVRLGATGSIAVGDARATVRGIGSLYLSGTPFTRLTVRGSAGSDSVTVLRPRRAGRAPVDIGLRGGNDSLELEGPMAGRGVLGSGEDELALYGSDGYRQPLRQDLVGSLAHGRLRFAGGLLRTGGLEDLTAGDFDVIDLTDGAASTFFYVYGCRIAIDAGPGDDYLGASLTTRLGRCHGPRLGAVLRGQAGDDDLTGTSRADVLIGGPGRDTIWDPSKRDRDRCAAEVIRQGC